MKVLTAFLTLFLSWGVAAAQVSPDGETAPNSVPDFDVANQGARVFVEKGCSACHSLGSGVVVGPDLAGVAIRRDQSWIEAMISRPDSMLRDDPIAWELGQTYGVDMPNLGVSATEVTALYAFLETVPAALDGGYASPPRSPRRGNCPRGGHCPSDGHHPCRR